MTGLIGDPDAFPRLFSRLTSSAFRLEVRRSYGVVEEDEPFRRFLAGKDPGVEWLRPWLDLMRETTERGVRVERVRVVDEPPSDYLRFELEMTPHNLDAGEDIRYLSRTVAGEIGLPPVDFWILDSASVYLLHFAEDDRFLGLEEVSTSSAVSEYVAYRDLAWKKALLFSRTMIMT